MTRGVLHQLGAVTGLGWTASFLGYVSTVAGYVPRLVGEPHALLYASFVLLLATLGIDKVAESGLVREERRAPRRQDDVLTDHR